jgi:CDP-6-deoxy-D-xylo-4-hexulose-3-dehydrase
MNDLNYPLATSSWDGKEIAAIESVVKSGQFTMGKIVADFEKNFANIFGSGFAVMSNSGSSANLLAMSALRYSKFRKKDYLGEVIVPSVSWSTTYYPISQLGFTLRFIDIDVDTLNSSPEQISEAIGPETVGIVAVNLLGNPSYLYDIRKIADEYGLFLVEDNCESMGAELDGQPTGTFGDIGTFSSFFSHHISTMEGGVSITASEELFQVMTSLRAHGWTRELPDKNFVFNKSGNGFEDSFRFVLPGYNLRPLELEGAIGIEQLKKLPTIVAGRRKNYLKFKNVLEGFPFIRTQKEVGRSSWFGFSMILENRARGLRRQLIHEFERVGIASRPIVAGNFTRNPVLAHLPHAPLPQLPNADLVHEDGLFIGNHHYEMSHEFDLLETALISFKKTCNI